MAGDVRIYPLRSWRQQEGDSLASVHYMVQIRRAFGQNCRNPSLFDVVRYLIHLESTVGEALRPNSTRFGLLGNLDL